MSYHSDYQIPDTRETAQGYLGQTFHDTDTPAVLMVFEPNRNHRLGDHYHRPMVYDFDDRFLNDAYRITDVGGKGGDTNELVLDVLRGPAAHSAIGAPVDADTVIDLSPIGENWRFVLILNKPKAPLDGRFSSFSSAIRHRVIMNGYFLTPPVSQFTGARDEQAVMVFTHKTVIEMNEAIGPKRRRNSLVDTRWDSTLVSPAVCGLSSEDKLFFTDPEASFMGTYDDAGGVTTARPSREHRVGYRDLTRAVDSRYTNPENNLKIAMVAAIGGRREVNDRGHTSHLYNESGLSNIPYARESGYRAALGRHFNSKGDTSQILGYDPNDTLTLAQLGRDYVVRFQRVDSDQSGQFDIMDGALPTPNNVFCSILAEAIPTVLASMGLLRLDFSFDCFYENSRRDTVDPYRMGVDFVVPVIPMNDKIAADTGVRAVRELERGVFQNVRAGHGDFRLQASVDLTGLTFLQLHFKADDQRYREPYEHPTIFSGLVTNQFGSPSAAQHNANQMARFVNAVTTTDSDYDDRPLRLPGDEDRYDDRYSDRRDDRDDRGDGDYRFPDLAL